jgi:hypothetical protein
MTIWPGRAVGCWSMSCSPRTSKSRTTFSAASRGGLSSCAPGCCGRRKLRLEVLTWVRQPARARPNHPETVLKCAIPLDNAALRAIQAWPRVVGDPRRDAQLSTISISDLIGSWIIRRQDDRTRGQKGLPRIQDPSGSKAALMRPRRTRSAGSSISSSGPSSSNRSIVKALHRLHSSAAISAAAPSLLASTKNGIAAI